MVYIPAGTFMMGSTDNEYGWAQYTTPVHQVTLQAFDIGAYEVTQAQYEAVIGTNPSNFQGPTYPNTENNPVEMVSWYDARTFCTALSALTGRTFTLPSEAQWEYACRAGTTTLYSYGDSDALLGDYAWYWNNSGSLTHTVGTKLPNNWNLYDMHGNVWEWCLDSLHTNYTGAPNDGSAWEPETGSDRMIRGGSWLDGYPRSASRAYTFPDDRHIILGFRVLAVR
jgi:formylglycine-generating enzyme required for sulfatase activity